MPLFQTIEPALRALDLSDVKEHLRVDHENDDNYIRGCMLAAEQALDGRDGWLGRALVSQTWQLKLDDFQRPAIRIPLPPLIEVQSVQYYDSDNALQTLSTSIYEVAGIGGHAPARVVLKRGQSWPTVYYRSEAVTITFRAGYVDTDASPTTALPEPIKQAMMLMVGDLYENRQTEFVGTVVARSRAVESLLAPYEVAYFGAP